MHDATQQYLTAAAADEALHADLTAALRAAMVPLTALTQHAADKQHALFAARIDETEPHVAAMFEEADDKLKSTARLAAEWQLATVSLSRLLQEITAFNTRFAATAAAADAGITLA